MWSTLLLLGVGLALSTGIPQNQGLSAQDNAQVLPLVDCTGEKDGVSFTDPDYCDIYWTCEAERAIENYCDDGLVFDEFKGLAGRVDPCDSPFRVDCSERPLLQEPTNPSADCVRRHGIFPHPDPTVCNIFHICKDGFLENAQTCSTGLHFNKVTGACEWPRTAGREGCNTIIKNCINNGEFCCTGEDVIDEHGMSNPHPLYPNQADCRKFYVCLEKVTPQEASCDLGQVYNDKTTLCDYPENVPECIGWYRDHPEFAHYYEDSPVDGGRDVGAQDTII